MLENIVRFVHRDREVNKERAGLESTVEAYDTYRDLEAQLVDAKALFSESGDDAELRARAIAAGVVPAVFDFEQLLPSS